MTAASVSPTGDFEYDQSYRDDTLGLGVKYKPRDNLSVGMQFIYGNSIGSTDYTNVGAANAVAAAVPFPDTKYRSQDLQLYAKYDYTKDVTMRVNYWYQKAETTDWAWDGVTPTTNNILILDGHQNPNYKNHIVGVSVAFKNW
jgi:opacity protein-like surface antigen